MRHSDFIGIGKAERKTHVYFILVFNNGVQLTADVTSRFLNLQQKLFDFLVNHNSPQRYLSSFKNTVSIRYRLINSIEKLYFE